MLLLAPAVAGPEEIPGRWYPVAPTATEQALEVARLEALGYLDGYEPDTAETGVVWWDRERAYAAPSVYNSGHAPEALLVAMDGRVLHRWTMPYGEAFPELPSRDARATGAWRRVALRPSDGHLLGVYEGLGLVHLDASSRIVWTRANRAHHEAVWLPGGGVLVLTRTLHSAGGAGGQPFLEDCVSELDAGGEEVRRVSVLRALAASPWAWLLDRSPVDGGDPLHTNALFPLDAVPGEPAGKGRVLLSMRHLDALAVLDLDEERIVWAATGSWHRQHDAEIAASGHLLLFDNQGGPDETSRVLALRPWTLEPAWTFSGVRGDRPLESRVLGAVQELPNGHLLVTESTHGRVLEVTPRGEVVWEFHNPRTVGPDAAYVAAVFEMVRLPAETKLSWLR